MLDCRPVNSAATMIYTFLMIFTMLYISSCVAIELITTKMKAVGPACESDVEELPQDFFPSPAGAMREQSLRLAGRANGASEALEHVFFAVYSAELLMNFWVRGRWALLDKWIRFDIFLLGSGIATQWILKPVFGDLDGLGFLMVLRAARLTRLARTVRLLLNFKEL